MNKGSKMTKKQRDRVSNGHKGQIPWNKGKKMPKEFCDKIRKANKKGICGMLGKKHSKDTKKLQSKNNNTKLLWENKEYRQMMSDSHKGKMLGKDNPAYIDGRKPLVMRIRNHWMTENWRKSIFERDNYTCQDCKERGKELEAHHIYPFSKIITKYKIDTLKKAIDCNLMWDTNNGKTLCKKCHKKISTR